MNLRAVRRLLVSFALWLVGIVVGGNGVALIYAGVLTAFGLQGFPRRPALGFVAMLCGAVLMALATFVFTKRLRWRHAAVRANPAGVGGNQHQPTLPRRQDSPGEQQRR